jgi:hypothetical protein
LSFKGKKIAFAVKEAGVGALISSMLKDSDILNGSVCFASEVSIGYFFNSDLKLYLCKKNVIPNNIALEEILKSVDIIVIGMSAGKSIEKQICTVGLELKIPVYAYVDHYWNLWQRFADENTAQRWTYIPDRIYVMDDFLKNRIIAQGAPREKIWTYCNPLLNSMSVGTSKLDREKSRKLLGIDKKSMVILFVSEYNFPVSNKWQWEQSTDFDIQNLLKILVSSVKKAMLTLKQPIILIIKKHPSDTHDWERIYKDPFCKVIDICDKDTLFDIVDMAFGLNSMMLLEAANKCVPAYSFHENECGREITLSSFSKEIIELQDEKDFYNEIINTLNMKKI